LQSRMLDEALTGARLNPAILAEREGDNLCERNER
jgi:hypothetical protein